MLTSLKLLEVDIFLDLNLKFNQEILTMLLIIVQKMTLFSNKLFQTKMNKQKL
jgi:hypothetical protein